MEPGGGSTHGRSFLAALITARPEWLYLILSTVLGVGYLAIVPPFQVGDEYNHFYRAYQVSEGTFVSRQTDDCLGGSLPRGIVKLAQTFPQSSEKYGREVHLKPLLRQAARIELAPGDRVDTHFPNTALYPPIGYLPQAAGIAVSRLFSSRPLYLFYAARLANVATMALLGFLAIRIAPVFKWFLFAVMSLPMVLTQSGSVSADLPTNALAFLLVALVLACLDGAEAVPRLSVPRLALLAVVCLLLTLTKNAYIGLAGLVLLIPPYRFGSFGRYVGTVALVFGVCAGAGVAWAGTVSRFLEVQMNPYAVTNASAQVRHIVEHPLMFLGAVVRTVVRDGGRLVSTAVGCFAWSGKFYSPLLAWIAYPLLLVAAVAGGGARVRLRPAQRFVLMLVLGVTGLLICVAIYIQWNNVAENVINGMQGRYFVPLLPVFFLLFSNRRWALRDNRLQAILGLMVLVGTCAMSAISFRSIMLEYGLR